MAATDALGAKPVRSSAHDGHILAAARGTGFLALGSFFEAGVRFLIALMLARLLGAGNYGLYVLAISTVTLFASFSALGLDDAMVRYVAILAGRRDGLGVRGTIKLGVLVSGVGGVLIAAVMFVAAQPIAEGIFDEPRLTHLLRLLAIVVPFLSMSNVLAGTARGFGRMDYVALAENVVQSLVRLALIAIIAVAMRGLNVTAAAVAFGISDVSATVVFIVLLQKYVPLSTLGQGDMRSVAPQVFRFSVPLWLSGMLRQFRRSFQTILLGATAAAASVGIYSIVSSITSVGHICLLALFVAVKPMLARMHDVGDRDGLTHLYTTATRWAYTITLPFFLVIVLFRDSILLVFGETFAAGSTALLIYAFAEVVNAGTGICGPVLDMTGHVGMKLFNAVTLTVLLVVGNVLLIPRYGVVGAAIASLVGIGVSNLMCLVEIWWLEHLLPFDLTFWKPTVAALGALAAGLGLIYVQPPGPNATLAAAEGLVVGAVFAVLLLLTRLPEDDRLVLRRMWAKTDDVLHRLPRLRRSTRTGTNSHAPALAHVSVDASRSSAADLVASSRPIYIGGLDRSGKTTMAAFLTSHPDIAVPDVGSNMWTYFYGQYGDLSRPENFERCLDAMLRYKHVLYLEPDVERIRREFADGPRTYGALFALILDHWAERRGKPRWGVQTGLIERYAERIFAETPQAKVVHMVRDPRDRYEGSLELWPAGRGRAGGATARWTYSCHLAESHVRRHPENYVVVRYEDMVLRTDATLRHVCAFLDIEFVPEMLDMGGAPDRRDRLASRAGVSATETPLSSEFIGRFRDVVPRDELLFIQLHAGRLMREHGYEPDAMRLSPTEWSRFAVIAWPRQAARMLAWRTVEAVQQRLPTRVGRKPDPRTIVDASRVVGAER
jgi:O-antigen/teichoic acid export membrane protein